MDDSEHNKLSKILSIVVTVTFVQDWLYTGTLHVYRVAVHLAFYVRGVHMPSCIQKSQVLTPM